MGQLEKYGLYVLCLVIFLILGVTIWGDPDSPAPQQNGEVVPMRVSAAGTLLPESSLQPRNHELSSGDGQGNLPAAGNSGMLSSLLKPPPLSNRKPKSKPKLPPPVGNDPDPVKPTPVPVVPPSVASTREYTVKKGDMLSRIAEKQLGSARLVGQIRDLNKGLSDDLKIGQVLILPARSNASEAAAVAGAYRTYTISKGDNFEGIAKAELKSAARVREIKNLNPNINPRRLIPGKKIKLPLK